MKLEITTSQKTKNKDFVKLVQDLCTLVFGDNWTMRIDPSNKPTHKPDLYRMLVERRDASSTPVAVTAALDNILIDYDQAMMHKEA